MLGVEWDQVCADPPELWGAERPWQVISLAGTGVIVQAGATVTFKAPFIHVMPGFHAEEGAVVSICRE